MSLIALTLLSTLLSSGNSVLEKWLMDRRQVHPFAFLASLGIVALATGLVGLLVFPLPPWPEALLGITAGALCVAAVWLYFDTAAQEDISRLEPLMRLTSAEVLILGVLFLGETLNGRQQLAFGAMLVSSALLSIKPDRSRITISWRAFRVLPATILLAINAVLMAHVYRTTSVWIGMVWENLGIGITVALLTLTIRRSGNNLWCAPQRGIWLVLVSQQVIWQLIDLVPAYAVASGMPVALLSALNGVRPAWVWLLAVFVLSEPVHRYDVLFKGTGIGIMALGTYLLI